MNSSIGYCCYGLIGLLPFLPGAAQAAFPQLKLEVICDSQLDSPVAMVSPGDGSGRLFIAEQRGQIRIFKKTTYSQRPKSDTVQILDNQI